MPDVTTPNPTTTNPATVQTAPQAPAAAPVAAEDGKHKPLELSHTFTDFEDVERTVTCRFRRPLRPQISRAVAGIRKDAMAALRALCLDCVVAEEKEKLKADLDQYDGLGSTFGSEILGRVGFGELGK